MKNKVAVFGVFTSLALILSYVELLIPINLGIPGMKLGLANLLVVILLYKCGPRDALLLSVIRILLSGLIFGNMFSIFYSLGGGLLSLAVMVFLKKTGQFTVAGISIGGGASHNVGQLLVAMFVVQTYQVGYYLPVLLIAGVITGAVIGILSAEVLKRTQSIRL
ncbi:Gx transporter family protein [[Ruminococcus] lactaris]|jgi:heptaprenyl diphosphate synthase component I|uniref:Gx transporter family protein n=1 Tax=[Ruminococcus] lactaris TaxID=46228 RepID=UPI00241E460D|nr:Gx transporter family protein [[Ruminococcus] lactaris]